MKITVDKDKVKIEEFDVVHEGEHRVNKCSFSFSEEYTEELVKKAIFTSQNSSVEVAIINNECNIPTEILKARNIVLLGVYAYKVVDDKLDLRYSPSPDAFKVNSGSYIEGANESEEITPSQFEQYMQAMNDGLNKVEESIKKMDEATSSANDLVDNINQKLENGDFIGPEGPQGVPGNDGIDGVGITTITSGQSTVEDDKTVTPVTVQKTDGSSQIFKVEAKNGMNGQDGKDGKDGVNGKNGQDGLTPSIGENGNWFIGDTDTGKPSRGEVGPSPDSSDYVKNTDYANASKAGIIKATNYLNVTSDGVAYASPITQEIYESTNPNVFIAKGTLENIKDDYVGSSNPVITLNNTLDNLVRKNRVSDYIISLKDALKYKVFEFLVHGKVKKETTTGKNKLDYTYLSLNEEQSTLNGGSYTYENGLLEIDATKATNNMTIRSSNISNSEFVLKAGTYYAHVCINTKKVSDGTFTQYMAGQITLAEDVYINQWFVPCPKGTKENTILMIEPGNEKTEWEPYTGGQPNPIPDYPQPITTLTFDKITRCGNNLYDVNDTSSISDSVSIDDDGWINVNIDNSSGTNTKFANVWTYPKYNIKVNTSYKLVLEIKSHSGNNGYLSPVSNDNSSYSQFNNQYQYFFYNIVDNSISVYDILSQKSFDKAKTMLRTFVACYAGEKLQITFRISVIENTSVTPQNFVYEPYQATEYAIDLQGNEMVELPNGVKDELVVDKYGNVSLIKNVGKVVLDGSEIWELSSFTNNTILSAFYNIKTMKYLTTFITDRFKYVGSVSAATEYEYCSTGGQSIRIGINKSRLTSSDIDGFKQWLQENNVEVYYSLATPQTIPLGTLSELITTLNGTNNIFINGNIPTTISITYALDIKKYIDNKLAEISTAMIEEG